jgi:hypothetical protein
MTNTSMRATFGRKFITHTGLEHPEQLFTPAGSGMMECLITGRDGVSQHRERQHAEAELAKYIDLVEGTRPWGTRCGYEALRETVYDLQRRDTVERLSREFSRTTGLVAAE